jgi:hypothetical protein
VVEFRITSTLTMVFKVLASRALKESEIKESDKEAQKGETDALPEGGLSTLSSPKVQSTLEDFYHEAGIDVVTRVVF